MKLATIKTIDLVGLEDGTELIRIDSTHWLERVGEDEWVMADAEFCPELEELVAE
jgi:hypothetical protein